MRIKLLFIVFSFFFISTKAQTWQWAKLGGGIYSDKAQAIDIDNNGNSYVGGFYNVGQPASITVNFGPITPTVNWGKEGFLAKVDKFGNYLWVHGAIGGYDERVLGVHVDRLNNFVYATGTTWGWGTGANDITFGSCYNNANYGDADNIFLGKFDTNGNCQWMVTAGGESDDHGLDIATDKYGNVYLTGFVSDKYATAAPAVFGTFSVTAPIGDSLAFVAKLSPAGVFQWVQTFGGHDGERDHKIEVDSACNVYITGGFYGTKAFGTTTLTANGVDIYVVKYDKNGNFIWVKQTGSSLDDRANGITIDPSQKIYITGEFRDTCAFGNDTLNNNGGPNGRDIFVAKLTTDGVWKWAKKAGSGEGGERGNSICTNTKGNIFVTGTFADTAKFGGSISLISSPFATVDVFVAAIDTLGKWRWAVKGGGAMEDKGNGIACDDSCNIYTTGWFDQLASFGPHNLTSTGSKDIYVARLNSTCFTYTTDIINGNEDLDPNRLYGYVFPNPTSNILQVKINAVNFDAQNTRITFIDMLGKEVNVTAITDKDLLFDVSSLQQGIYFVVLKNGNASSTFKFVKQ
jgi:hypothetical protein